MITERSFKCRICGGEVTWEKGSSMGECIYCGSKQPIPSNLTAHTQDLYNDAFEYLKKNEYDKAFVVYENIIKENPNDAEAYWGRCLCRYGIEYVDDPNTGKKIPTCHRLQAKSILKDEDYLSALKYAPDEATKSLYTMRATTIDVIQRDIISISQGEEGKYDIFISFKDTDNNENRTKDSHLAEEIYNELTKKGYKVFFSRVTLAQKLGAVYEPYIYAAIHSAKIMIVVGTKPEYIESAWVRNEWSRYLDLIREGSDKKFIVCFKDMNRKALPEEFVPFQNLDMNDSESLKVLVQNVKDILGSFHCLPVKEKKIVISNISCIGATDPSDLWPKGKPSSVINLNQYAHMRFLVNFVQPIDHDQDLEYGLRIYDAKNHLVYENISTVAAKAGHNMFSQHWNLQLVKPGKYYAEIWYGNSGIYKYKFSIEAPKKKRGCGGCLIPLLIVLGIIGAIIYLAWGPIQNLWQEIQYEAGITGNPSSGNNNWGNTTLSGELTQIQLNVDKTSIMYGDTVHLSFSTSPSNPTKVDGKSYNANCIEYYIRVNGVDKRINNKETSLDYVVESTGEISFWAKYCHHSSHSDTAGDVVSNEVKITVANENGLYYKDNGNGVKIVGYSGSVANLTIPSAINGKTVNAIASGAFLNCSTLKTITVLDSVTSIGFGAFSGCNNLTEMTLPFVGGSANATESRGAVFGYIFGDKDLGDDDMDKSTTKYSTSSSSGFTSQSHWSDNTNYMFYFAIPKSIRKVTITNQTKIPEYAFQNCDLIKEIKFTTEITDVGLNSFQKCSALSVCDFSVSDSTIINQYAFQNCTSLTTFTVPDGVIKISAYTFDGCTALTTLVIPNTVETISACAFKNCAGLTSIIVPNSVTSIGGGAFAGCNGLVEMTLPFVGSNINATEDRWAVFGYIFGDKNPDEDGMDKSTTKYSTSGSAGLTSQSHWSDNTNYMFYYAIPKSIKKVTITNQTTVPAYAFQNCDLIKEITFEKTVTYIDTYAFSNAASLTQIGLSVSADTVIQSYAFANCDSFTEFIIPNGVLELGDYAYSGCDRLKKIEIPNTLILIGGWAFNGCSALADITIPGSVEKIGNCAFKNCISLTSIVIPNSVVKIGGGAFAGCNGLVEMILPFVGGSANATEDRWAVFGYIFGDKNPDEDGMDKSTTKYSTSGSAGLTSQSHWSDNTNYMFYFVIPKNLRKVTITNQTNIPAYAFQNCDLIREITFTKAVEMIGAQAFENCSSLKTVNYSGTQSEWNDIVFGANWNKNANDFSIVYNKQ